MSTAGQPGTPPRPTEAEQIEDRAADWLARRDGGLDPAGERALRDWLAQDTRHGTAFARLESTWQRLQGLAHFRPASRRHPDHDLLAERVAGRRLWAALAGIGTAAVLALATLALWRYPPSGGEPTVRVFTTTTGGYERVVLPDGSVLELNGDSHAEVAYGPARRAVRLRRGEAHINVAHQPARPFAVVAGEVVATALGTAFSVRLEPAEVEVLVTEGRVRIERAGDTAATELALVGPRERVLVPRRGPAAAAVPIEVLDPAGLRRALAWQERKVFFSGTPLGEVAALFNRNNRIQLRLADPALAARPVGGVFHVAEIEAFVALLVESREVVVQLRTETEIVLGARPPG